MLPAKSEVQVDTPEVRVTRWQLAPGSATGHHIHEMDYVIVPVTAGEMTIVAPGGERSKAQLAVGKSYFRKAGGQSHYLMRVDQGDLHDSTADEKDPRAKRMAGIRKDTLTIVVQYDAPTRIVNRILRGPRRWRILRQYETSFVFDPQIFAGDLRPPNYA